MGQRTWCTSFFQGQNAAQLIIVFRVGGLHACSMASHSARGSSSSPWKWGTINSAWNSRTQARALAVGCPAPSFRRAAWMSTKGGVPNNHADCFHTKGHTSTRVPEMWRISTAGSAIVPAHIESSTADPYNTYDMVMGVSSIWVRWECHGHWTNAFRT